MPKFEYTVAEQAVQSLAPGFFKDMMLRWMPNKWQPPKVAPFSTFERPLDRTLIQARERFEWPTELRIPLALTPPNVVPYENSIGGQPLQRVAVNAPTQTWVEIDTIHRGGPGAPHVRDVQVPVPVDNDWWIEGHPAISGAWDHHVLLVRPETAEAWEMIGANRLTKTCLLWGHWKNGGLVDGTPVCASQVSLTSVLYNRFDPEHTMGLYMNDYRDADGTKTSGSGWPRCGDHYALSNTAYAALRQRSRTPEQRAFIEAAYHYGFKIYDRTGHQAPSIGVGMFAGAQWAGSSISGITILATDLDLVVG